MKNTIKYFLRAGLLLMTGFLIACSPDETDDTGFDAATPQLKINADPSVSVPDVSNTLTVPVEANLPWRAKTDVDWITFEKGRGSGSSDLVMVILSNETRIERKGTVTVWITEEETETFEVVQQLYVPDQKDYYVKVGGDAGASGLSWGEAVTLPAAIKKARLADRIHIAAGKYTPETTIVNGNADNPRDRTFQLGACISLIGGYPADAQEGAIADPAVNETILSGAMNDGMAYHVLVASAPRDFEYKVEVKGVTISDGETAAKGSGVVSVSGMNVERSYGGGIIVSGAEVYFENCTIKGNKTNEHAGAGYIAGGADVTFESCLIAGNSGLTGSSNCAGFFVTASTVVINNSTFSGNMTTGVAGALYAFHASQPTYLNVYNTTFTGNHTNLAGSNKGRRGAAFYAREKSESVFVNCTFSGNTGGNGGAISAYGTASAPSRVNIVSCTITGNLAETNGGGLEIANGNATVNVYNTVISGNTADGSGNDLHVAGGSGLTAKQSYIIGADVFNSAGGAVAVAFDPSTMLGPLADNGGKTQTVALTGAGNPALDHGKSLSELEAIAADLGIPAAIAAGDQRGVSRSGKTAIGAWVDE